MQDKDCVSPLIQTKIHRPLVPVDLVPRPQLTDWLDERRHRRLTLVSAPAGYGKSTLISSWLVLQQMLLASTPLTGWEPLQVVWLLY